MSASELPASQELMPAPQVASTSKSSWPMLLQFLAGGAFGLGAAHLASRFGDLAGIDGFVGMLVGLAIGSWLQTVLHEAGHAIAGRLAGMRLVAFGLGRWRWMRGQSGWHRPPGKAVAGIGGFAAMLPEAGRTPGSGGYGLFMAGGIIANLLASLLLWLAMRWTSGWLTGLLAGIAMIGMLMAVVNLVPWRTRSGWQTDGYKLLDLWRRPEHFRAALALQQAAQLQMSGVRPRDWPAQLEPRLPATLSSDDPDGGLRLLMRMGWACDRGDLQAWAQAARLGPRAHAVLPEGLRAYAAISMASYAALVQRDARLLDAWRPLCEDAVLPSAATLHWLDAESAWLRGDADAARAQIAAARQALDKALDAVSQLQLGEFLDALQARLPAPADTAANAAPVSAPAGTG